MITSSMDSTQRHQQADASFIIPEKEGKKYVYKPKGLKIIWGKDERYWKIDNDAAELLQVSWLEVTGILERVLKPEKTYKISFVISVQPHAFGWEGIQIFLMAKVGRQGKYIRQPFSPDKENNTEFSLKVKTPNSKDLTLYFGLYEVFSGVWKGGLKIYKAIVEEVGEENKQNQN